MKRILASAITLLFLSGMPAIAAPLSAPCLETGPSATTCNPVNSTNPMPVTVGPSSAAGAGLTPAATAALASNKVVKSSAGNLYSFQVSADSTLSAAAWWVMIFDATSLPANGAVTPVKCYAYPAGTTSASYGWSSPVAFATGITIGVSTTGCFTITASVHAFISGDAQ